MEAAVTDIDMQARTERWLEAQGLSASFDPDVSVLLDAARELDWLAEPARDLADKDLVMMRRAVRHAYTTARRNIQKMLDRADSAQALKRHQMVFGRIAAESLGWVDADLLSPELRVQVMEYLEAHHDINAGDYRGVSETL